MSQRLLDRQTLNSLIDELTEISDLAVAENAESNGDLRRLQQQTDQLAALSEAAFAAEEEQQERLLETPNELPTSMFDDAPATDTAQESGVTDDSVSSSAKAAAETDEPRSINFDERSDTLECEWDYTQDAALLSQRVHSSIQRWLEQAQCRGVISQLQLDFVQLANSGEAPQQWRCSLQKNKGRQRHLQIVCDYKKQRQLTAQAVVHTH